jgi:hypothetical protein
LINWIGERLHRAFDAEFGDQEWARGILDDGDARIEREAERARALHGLAPRLG